MPVYEYRCPACDDRFERLAPMVERDAQVPCPVCGRKTSRQITAFALVGSPAENGGGGCVGCAGGCACGR